MGFQPPVTVARALAHVHARQYVLPAIQREFIWSPAQVCLLFDSLLRGYPIGSFLLWEVNADQAQDFRATSREVVYEMTTSRSVSI